MDLKPSSALRLWHDVMLAHVHGSDTDLSARQMVILLTIYIEPPPHTVRGLAAKLAVTKPVITRALDTLGERDLVQRRRDESDRRNVIIQRTVKGALWVERFADIVIGRARELSRRT